MTDEQKPKAERIQNLELNRETIQDLTEEAAEQAAGGMFAGSFLARPVPTEEISCPCNLTTIGIPRV